MFFTFRFKFRISIDLYKIEAKTVSSENLNIKKEKKSSLD